MKKRLRRKMFYQRMCGVLLLLLAVVLVLVAMTGTTVEDRDAGAVLLCIPSGIYLLTTKTRIF